MNQRTPAGTDAPIPPHPASPLPQPAPRLWNARAFGGEAGPDEFDALTDLFLGEVATRARRSTGSQTERPALRLTTGPGAEDRTKPLALRSPARSEVPVAAERPFVECVVLGHLPVLASAWASQYVREIAQAAGRPVAFVRVQAGFATVELVGDGVPAGRPGERDAASVEEAIAAAARVTDRWIVRADPGEETEIAAGPLIRMVTLLTGPDEAARVSAYSLLKTLGKRLPDPRDGSGPMVRIALMSAPEAAAGAASARLAEAVRQFLGRDVQQATCSARIVAAKPPVLLFNGRTDLPARGVVALIERIGGTGGGLDASDTPAPARSGPGRAPAEEAPVVDFVLPSDLPPETQTLERIAAVPAPEPEPAVTPEPRAAPAAAAVEQGAAAPFSRPPALVPIIDEPEPRHPEPPAASPAYEPPAATTLPTGADFSPVLAGHLPDLRPLSLRCPYAEGVELATDATGALHLLTRSQGEPDDERALAALLVVSAWATAHRQLLAACTGTASAAPATLHLFTSEPKRSRRLLETDLRVHLLASVAVGGRTGWFCTDLN